MATTTKSPELKTYVGCCHCGAFKYTLRVPEIEKTTVCNCSFCSVKGFYFLFPGKKEALTVERGGDGLKEYSFASGKMLWKFCPKCGSMPLITTKDDKEGNQYAINLRCTQGVDIWSLKVNTYDGASATPSHHRPEPMAHTLTPTEGQKVYTGNCHCGAIKLAAALQPLPTVSVTEDQCSICKRNACTMHYFPPSALQLEPPDTPTLVRYKFNRLMCEHRFCGTCSVQVMIGKPTVLEEPAGGWSAEQREHARKESVGVNVRCLRDVEWEGGEVGAEGKKGGENVYVLRRMGDWLGDYLVQ